MNLPEEVHLLSPGGFRMYIEMRFLASVNDLERSVMPGSPISLVGDLHGSVFVQLPVGGNISQVIKTFLNVLNGVND